MTATVSPRLRVDNKFKVCNLFGQSLLAKEYAELFQVVARPTAHFDDAGVLAFDECMRLKCAELPSAVVKKVAAYVPPSMRKPGAANSPAPSANKKTASSNGAVGNKNAGAAASQNLPNDLSKKLGISSKPVQK